MPPQSSQKSGVFRINRTGVCGGVDLPTGAQQKRFRSNDSDRVCLSTSDSCCRDWHMPKVKLPQLELRLA
jgi:hypothetical protein